MVEKVFDPDSGVALDLNRLLGFKRFAICADRQAVLARALGAVYNKAGAGETPPPLNPLARALGVAYNKVGEVFITAD